MENRSEHINELTNALAIAQAEIKNPTKDSANPFFKSKYADLATIWDAVRQPLTKQGLAFMQLPSSDGPKVMVTGILSHKSGQFIESTLTMTAKDSTPQAIGSALTYARRYQLSAMCGVAPQDEDDDGNHAQGHQAKTEHNTDRDEYFKRMKARRAALNQALLVCTDEKSFKLARGKFEKEHGKEIMQELTTHKPEETFFTMLAEHWARISDNLAMSGPEGVKTFLKGLGEVNSVAGLKGFVQSFKSNQKFDTTEIEDALHEKAIILGLSNYMEAIEQPA